MFCESVEHYSKNVGRARDRRSASIEHVGVNHRGLHSTVAQQLLNCADDHSDFRHAEPHCPSLRAGDPHPPSRAPAPTHAGRGLGMQPAPSSGSDADLSLHSKMGEEVIDLKACHV